jgi:hypothetical protein
MKKIKDLFFEPWIGNNFENGIVGFDENGRIVYGSTSMQGKKILILGESHYVKSLSENIRSLTNKVIRRYMDKNQKFEGWMNTFTKFEKSFHGYNISQKEEKSFWDHVAFYNYIQEPMKADRMRPNKEQFNKAIEPFFELISALKPDIIIVWGRRLYKKLPVSNKLLVNGEKGASLRDVKDKELDTWIYTLNDNGKEKQIHVVGIYHPSAGYSIERWYNIIKQSFSL